MWVWCMVISTARRLHLLRDNKKKKKRKKRKKDNSSAGEYISQHPRYQAHIVDTVPVFAL